MVGIRENRKEFWRKICVICNCFACFSSMKYFLSLSPTLPPTLLYEVFCDLSYFNGGFDLLLEKVVRRWSHFIEAIWRTEDIIENKTESSSSLQVI